MLVCVALELSFLEDVQYIFVMSDKDCTVRTTSTDTHA